ncbi:fungal-specific transcription factor domain-containing protein [Sphaerosporella brunnea]|uniref:Fungal-specific transcription factor domain-containing protein n=1 Tax=Sphaerosporella brunnea TaxID=1250544 RepID=A0A5J5EW16_9PEZI|nr:fungal-specific transcription factor domain-containing protein [Sphaerosporella brunnea]
MDALSVSVPASNASSGHGSIGPGAEMKIGRAGVESSGLVIKPKQSKSRNGCVTCKAKRLKCDETKPTCRQCQKRGVPCGGYKKDFKWRPFEEAAIAGKGLKTTRKGIQKKKSPPSRITGEQLNQISFGPTRPGPEPLPNGFFHLDPIYIIPNDASKHLQTPPLSAALPADVNIPRDHDVDLCGNDQLGISSGMEGMQRPPAIPTQNLFDLAGILGNMEQGATSVDVLPEIAEDEIEEVIRGGTGQGLIASPALSMASTSSSDSSSSNGEHFISMHEIFRRPKLTVDSPEILLSYFDKNTCGIMSVKDGPTENPWRTLIWPLAYDSQALYHAISSMTAFHMSRERPELRVEGMEHMRKSIRFLAQGLSHGNIRQDAALATTLVLAFSEAFDRHISTGIEHLRGARVLLNQQLIRITPPSIQTAGFQRLKFLFNVWVYLDVLARLTSDEEENAGMDPRNTYAPLMESSEIDPLLGCAATLFPLIGEAACLVQRVRRSAKNSVGIIASAMDLKVQLESWQVREYYEPIEDPTSDVTHCITTAEAYRWATLLYLHQAVPELPSPSAHELADKVMRLIASIPPASRCCIIHIYPLLAAGCEAVGHEERNWVKERWEGMSSRMWIGNIDKAWEVVKEVWYRRDVFRATHSVSRYRSPPYDELNDVDIWNKEFEQGPPVVASPKRMFDFGTTRPPPHLQTTQRGGASDVLQEHRKGGYEYEVSIKGNLHWLGVMKDWRWEVLLG